MLIYSLTPKRQSKHSVETSRAVRVILHDVDGAKGDVVGSWSFKNYMKIDTNYLFQLSTWLRQFRPMDVSDHEQQQQNSNKWLQLQ